MLLWISKTKDVVSHGRFHLLDIRSGAFLQGVFAGCKQSFVQPCNKLISPELFSPNLSETVSRSQTRLGLLTLTSDFSASWNPISGSSKSTPLGKSQRLAKWPQRRKCTL